MPNGVDHGHRNLPSPNAPSFVALDAKTGAIVWSNRDSENKILHDQWSSAAYGQFGGVSQVICPSGSGWLFGLNAATGETLWKFDCNPKGAEWHLGSKGRRNNLIAKPLIHDGRVYMATGQDPEHGEGNADLWCIDPTKRGDVSPTIIKRSQFVPNPDSAVVWHFGQEEFTPNGEPVFESFFHRSISTPVAKDGLLIAADTAGPVHCFDVKTGKRHWTHDLFAACLSSPIIINGQVYVGDEDGDVAILAVSKQKKLIAEINMKEVIRTTPTASDDALYVATQSRLFAMKPRATPDDSAAVAKATVDQLLQRNQEMATLQLLSRQIAVLSAALDSTKKRGSQIAVEREKLKQQMTALELRLKAVKQLVDEVSEN